MEKKTFVNIIGSRKTIESKVKNYITFYVFVQEFYYIIH